MTASGAHGSDQGSDQGSDLAAALSELAGAAFAELGLDPALGRVRRADRPDLGQFQCNGAMAGAKAAGKPPREIAVSVAGRLARADIIASAEVAGPGFINLVLEDDALAGRAAAIAADDRAGAALSAAPERIVIDFGGPNVAKPMHVGHLRSAVIGDALQRLLRLRGHEVISDVHLGDWGLQMGHLITELEDERPDLPYFQESAAGPFPDAPPVTIEDLARLYPQASAKAKADPARHARSRRATAELQAGRPGYRALLQHFIDVSVAALKKDYERLGVRFDLWKGESDVDALVAPMAAELKTKGVAEESEGAWVIRVAREGDGKELAPLILITSEGSSLYGTTDLATILDRKAHLSPDRILYVVDQRQADHFEQVFRAAAIAGIFPYERLEHIGFGTVNGKDGKPYKTREGGVMRLADLFDQAIEKARQRLAETGIGADYNEAERAAIAEKVAMAAIRFADLQNVRTTNYVFDLDRFVSFEGKTGPYLLYQAVRIASVLRKAAASGVEAGAITLTEPAERELVLAMDGFPLALEIAEKGRHPHVIAEHAYTLASAFSRFYTECPIVTAEEPAVRASRLALAQALHGQLTAAMGLLGLEAPDRM